MAAIRAAGASLKLAHATTRILTEVATYLSDINAGANTDELDGGTFSPGATLPVKFPMFGATEYELGLSGRWTPAAETFFSALGGLQEIPYEFCPEGTAIGKTRIYGVCNVPAFPGPTGNVNGLWDFSLTLKATSRYVETIVTPPATVAITSSSIADPTVITTGASHLLTTGDVITISGHTGSTPAIAGAYGVTVLTATTFTIPVAVTVGGTGGTLQD
jgi:hypothetical protein